MAAAADAVAYAAKLRQQLIQDLFEGDEDNHVDRQGTNEDSLDITELVGGEEDQLTLQDVDQDIELYQSHDILRGILEQGRVNEYARDVDDKLRQTEMDAIQDYIAESDSMVTLHDQIKECDHILAGMEQLLGKFQSDLGKVSEEIRQLQVQSQTMSTKLKNRRATEHKLGNFIEHLTVSEKMVNAILESDVNDDYLEYLLELDKKLQFVAKDDVARLSQATKDLEPALEKLRIKALSKVRDFILTKIYMLKRPKTNVQIIQQSTLLRNKMFVRFIRQHGPDIYREIRNEYASIVSKIYSSHFKVYLDAMKKMVLPGPSQADVLGVPEAGGMGMGMVGTANVLSMFKKDAPGKQATEHVFELGERSVVLANLDQAPIVPHMAEAEGRKFPYEVIFRNVHKLLVDTSTSEYFFCLDFFEDEGVFKDLFTGMVQMVEADLAQVAQESWDMLGLLLMIRVSGELRKAQGAQIPPTLEEYLDRVQLLLWPRFKLVMDSQLSSVRQGTEKLLFSEQTTPHVVVRRYAALAASMLLLMAEYDTETQGMFKAQNFYDMMDRMWAAIFDLLLRMSNMFRDKRMGIIFLCTNYNHILTVLRQADARGLQGTASGAAAAPAPASRGGSAGGGVSGIGKTGAAALKECEDQLASCVGLYVEEQLSSHFPMLLEFVKKAEQQQKRLSVQEGQHIPNFAPAQASPILRDFASRWQHAIQGMLMEINTQFSDVGCGRHVLQASMTALLQYYTRMLELLKRQGPEGQQVVKDAVNVPAIMYEIKRITKA